MHTDISFLCEGYSMITGSLLERFPESIPAVPGFYAFLVRNGHGILCKAGCIANEEGAPGNGTRFEHFYSGQSRNLQAQVRSHLHGMAAATSFKLSLVALQHEYLAIWEERDSLMGVMDRKLDLFLQDNVLIAYKPAKIVSNGEADLVRASGGPLNMGSKSQEELLPNLDRLREKFREEIFGPVFP
jgi:hypothetical protein